MEEAVELAIDIKENLLSYLGTRLTEYTCRNHRCTHVNCGCQRRTDLSKHFHSFMYKNHYKKGRRLSGATIHVN